MAMFTYFGTDENDQLVGTFSISGAVDIDLNDQSGWMVEAYGYGGNDTFVGTVGNDQLFGQEGDDYLHGGNGTGTDALAGGAGADTLDGGGGSDWAYYIKSGSGVSVSLATGSGTGGEAEGDTLISIENLFGSQHGDTLVGNNDANQLDGRGGNDTLKGGGGADTLYGDGRADDAGNDTLKGGGGADILYGGFGIDTAAYNESPVGVIVSLSTGVANFGDAAGDFFDSIENLTGSAHNDWLVGNDPSAGGPDPWHGGNVLRGLDGNDDLLGLGGNDSLWGGNGHDELYGHSGIDTLRGEAGNDYLDGGPDYDTMVGGWGNDIYIVDNFGDVVTEFAGQGIDTVRTSASWAITAGADIETLRTTDDNGLAGLYLGGNASGNQIIGNNGDNFIDGHLGVDQMTGRGGDDVYFVDNAGDSVMESGGQGLDEVRTSVSWTLTAGADVETVRTTNAAGLGAINLTGNETGNVVTGNAGSNAINGGNGNDELVGLGGHDYFAFTTPLNAASNVDLLSDFSVADDTILLENTIFGAFAAGGLAAERFVVGAAAQDASDNIIYNSSTGALFYDSDGIGASAAVQFAAVTPGLALTHLDFIVV